tara:strand:+ start:4598 stop:5431 length:834 start_codon:yes stop_codon:yes gene_type:complete
MIDAAFSLINLALIVATLLLTFKGFPYAFVSLAGYFLSMTAITSLLGVWINPGKEHKSYLTKIFASLIGIAMLLAGEWIINKGGLVSLSFGDPSVEVGTTLTFSLIAWITGFLGALRGAHKSEGVNEVLPDDDAPTNTKVEYLLKLKVKTARTELITNISSTLLTLTSIIAPIYLAISTANPFKLFLILLFPIAVMSMGLCMRGGGFLVYLPTLAISILLITVSAPWWYWILGICICITYVQTISSIPLLKKEESHLFDKWQIEDAVSRMRTEEQNN